MSNFKKFSTLINAAAATLLNQKTTEVFRAAISGDALYDAYQAAFPAGTNEIFAERREHDCNTCRNFIRNVGNIVHIDKTTLKRTNIWALVKENAEDEYKVVAEILDALVDSHDIESVFVVTEGLYGKITTNDIVRNIRWNHFEAKIPKKLLLSEVGSRYVGTAQENTEILKRSLTEISKHAIDCVIELIAQNSLYRGSEFLSIVKNLDLCKLEYEALSSPRDKESYLWVTATLYTRFKSNVIGTLLSDITAGDELEVAVRKYEQKVAPANYKRTSALVTQGMIDQAKKKVEELGIEDALFRRFAQKVDIPVESVLFVDANVKPALIGGAFDNISANKQLSVSKKSLEAVAVVSVNEFIKNILPTAKKVELFTSSSLKNNFVSLIAPAVQDAPKLFSWDNGFSWSYVSETTDAVKERVKNAGGLVDGYGRVSLSWHNADDLDLSVSKGSKTIYFGEKNALGGELDVDMNAWGKFDDENPVENISWVNESNMREGAYTVAVTNYNRRRSTNPGFTVDFEFDGVRFSYTSATSPRDGERLVIATITKNKNGEVIVRGINGNTVEVGSSTTQQYWNVDMNNWVEVDTIMKSPNFWNNNAVGNEHLFFMLKDCKNPEDARGFYNEFLRSELVPHRKVFEVLASSLKAKYDDEQVSGVGASITSNQELTVRVTGATVRIVKVKF